MTIFHHQQTILIVEDDAGIAELEKQRLEGAGYGTRLTQSAAEALQVLQQESVDLILLDYRLPGDLDGLSFYSRVKSTGIDVPVILVTGYSNEATLIQALRMGVRDFVSKSMEYLDYLPEAVGRVLSQIRTEHELAASEARLASIIATATDAILVIDDSNRITLFNAAAETMFRCRAAEALGEPFVRFFRPADNLHESNRSDGGRQSPADIIRPGALGVRAGGADFPIEASVSHLEIDGGSFYTLVVRDVTDRKKLEGQLLHAQRMEAVGVLAGGVAHDFNNLLTVILGYCDMLLANSHMNSADRDIVLQVYRAGEQAASLTRQLLAFSRKQVLAPQILDLNALLRKVDKLIRRLAGPGIELVISLDGSIGCVMADPGQVEQVVMNLVINARDAMPKGGKLTLETRNTELDASYSREHLSVPPGSYVLLAITDTGTGIDEQIRPHIFEPFFTTKEVGKGTGLGLSTVHGIVQQSGGHIEVYSETGKGASFKIYLPRLTETGDAHKVSPEQTQAPRGSETILVAEDDVSIRTLARLALQSYGYTVLEAADGIEGLERGRNYNQPIHLLIADIVMPRLSGRELAEQLRQLHPNMKVLFISGYTDDAIVRHGLLSSGLAFLQKPFTPTMLGRKVREVLGETPQPAGLVG